MDYGGERAKGVFPPLSNYWGGGEGGWPPMPPSSYAYAVFNETPFKVERISASPAKIETGTA